MKAKGNVECAFDDGRMVLAQGVCRLHYRRWQSNKRRIRAWVERGNPRECWEWTGGNWSDKRPCVSWFDIETRQKKKIHAFRALMLISGGPVFDPGNLEAAHTCHNPRCVNWIYHGVWATHAENMAMGSSRAKI